ncbi:MAG: hypothetical protein JO001_15020 [Alphaproteobacteria bacterium]|nr:hypothetical protein [Alphaproteobacteria bacterium]
MTTSSLSPYQAPEPRQGPDFAGTALEGIAPVIVLVGVALLALYRWIVESDRKAQRNHIRGERLAAYRVRHRWKPSDIRPLLSIGVSEVAQRRMAALKGRGRPVVKPHRPFEGELVDKLTRFCNLFRPDATPSERRRSLKEGPWWKHEVEALYRGELAQARAMRIKGAYDHAERAIAATLRISQGKVHAICTEIRAMRRSDAGSANFPAMTLADYDAWMECGKLPMQLAE